MTANTLHDRIRELEPWYQDIELAPGMTTKSVPGVSTIGEPDTPGALWEQLAPHIGALDGLRVLDVGCNAGYMSFACKRLGAQYVLGIDQHALFIRQAEFCRSLLGVDVDFAHGFFQELESKQPFDLVLFCGVLYHLENWADGLDKVRELVAPDGTIVLETAIADVTRTCYEGKAYRGDSSTYFVPSPPVLRALLEERGFEVRRYFELSERAVAFLSPRASPSELARPAFQPLALLRRRHPQGDAVRSTASEDGGATG